MILFLALRTNIARNGTIFFNIAPNQSHVFTGNGMVKKLFGQLGHGNFVLTDQQQTRSIFINAVHQTWATFIARQAVAIAQNEKQVH